MIRDYKKFFTPEAVADRLCYLADIKPGMKCLEPHTGDGAIVEAIKRTKIPNLEIHGVERNYKYALYVVGNVDMLVLGDFLKAPLMPVYDRIIANPPFGNETDLDAHLRKMFDLLAGMGKLISIIPKGHPCPFPELRIPLQNWSSNKDGTTTPIEIVIGYKHYQPR